MSVPESIPEDREQSFPCEVCNGNIKLSAASGRWECDECGCLPGSKPVTKTEHEAAAGMGLEDAFMSHHEQPCDCAVCDDIAFRKSLRQKAQSKHDANCLLRLLLETLPIQLEQRKLTHDRTACAMLIQDSIDYLFRDGEDTLIESPSNNEQQVLRLAYQMGRDSLKREIEDWLTNGFDY